MAKILLVDDDRNFSHFTKTALVQKGFEVVIANAVDRALEEMKRSKPDLILMDILMPGISGAEAARMLRKDPDFKAIPIVFLTGLISTAEEDLESTGINIDEKNYQTLGKPCEIDELLRMIDRNLMKSRG